MTSPSSARQFCSSEVGFGSWRHLSGGRAMVAPGCGRRFYCRPRRAPHPPFPPHSSLRDRRGPRLPPFLWNPQEILLRYLKRKYQCWAIVFHT